MHRIISILTKMKIENSYLNMHIITLLHIMKSVAIFKISHLYHSNKISSFHIRNLMFWFILYIFCAVVLFANDIPIHCRRSVRTKLVQNLACLYWCPMKSVVKAIEATLKEFQMKNQRNNFQNSKVQTRINLMIQFWIILRKKSNRFAVSCKQKHSISKERETTKK